MYVRIFILLLVVTAAGCKTKQNGGDCNTTGHVEDLTGLDGCGLMIVTESGEKLLPARISVDGLELKAGQSARFGYRKLEGMAGICMAEDAMVEITCWTPTGKTDEIPNRPDCLDLERVPEKGWMPDLLNAFKSAKITKYRFRTNGWAYLFSGEKSFLYDCQGTLICQSSEPSAKDCLQLVEPGAEGKVIYEKP